jgi:hypothetical protein
MTTKPNHSMDDDLPTLRMAHDLQIAYSFFNEELFGGLLPPCLITLRADRQSYGYFKPKQFVSHDGKDYSHEIAINPSYIPARPMKDTMSTLVREMVHVWQTTSGRVSRIGYHNREYGMRLKSIGLIPYVPPKNENEKVNPDRISGEHLLHTIEKGGLFDKACDRLLDQELFVFHWLDLHPLAIPPGYSPPNAVTAKVTAGTPTDVASTVQRLASEAGFESTHVDATCSTVIAAPDFPERRFERVAPLMEWPNDNATRSTRAKFECPGCHARAWGSPKLEIKCVKCDRVFLKTVETRGYGANRDRRWRTPAVPAA